MQRHLARRAVRDAWIHDQGRLTSIIAVRFRLNPFVVDGPPIRFYAGAPVRVAGMVLGMLCVMDRVPRQLTDDQLRALRMSAEQVRRSGIVSSH